MKAAGRPTMPCLCVVAAIERLKVLKLSETLVLSRFQKRPTREGTMPSM